MKNSNSTFVLYVFGFFCQATRIQISSSAISLSIHSEPTMAWTKTDKQTNKQAKNTETHTRRSVTRIHSIYSVICDQFSRQIFSSTTKPDTSIRKNASIRTNDRSRCASTKYRKTWMPKITSWTFSTRYEMEKNHTKAKKNCDDFLHLEFHLLLSCSSLALLFIEFSSIVYQCQFELRVRISLTSPKIYVNK